MGHSICKSDDCDRHIGGVCHWTDVGGYCPDCAAKHIQELEAIVASLPKIGRLVDGEIVRDVVVHLGDDVWRVDHDSVRSIKVDKIEWRDQRPSALAGSSGFTYSIDKVYATRDAAEFAIQEARKS